MWTLFRFEILHILRDITQLLIIAVVIPLLLAPFVTRSFQQVQNQGLEAQQGTYFVAVAGKEAQFVREFLPKLKRFRELPLQSTPAESLREGLIDAYLTVAEAEPGDSKPVPQAVAQRQAGIPRVTIHYSSGRERSWRARDALQSALNLHLQELRNAALNKIGQDPQELYAIEDQNLATREQEHLQSLSALIPLVLVFVLFGTGSVTALDAIAGERERGSLATVMVSALSRWQITVAKWLSVAAISLAFGLLQFGGLFWTTGGFGGSGLSTLASGAWFELITLALLMCAQVSALLLWISARSHSFKQAQLLYMPALLVGAALAAVGWMQTLPLNSVVSILPISGLTLAIRDVLLQNASTPWLALSVLASLAWTWATLRSVSYSLELDSEPPHSDLPHEQMRQQLGQDIFWFYAFIAAAMIVLPGNFPTLSGLRGQVLLNQGLFLVASYLLLRLYGQPLVASFRLGSTSAMNWALCLLMAPVLHLCANSVAIISSWLVPMSEDNIRQMTELLLPDGLPMGELFFLIAVCPAICEELAFRGTLLHAVQKPGDRFRGGLYTCLLVGFVFGCFHFSLHRLLPTAVIGSILTWVALRTGSIWPCIMLHFANNALAVKLHTLHLDYTAFPAWTWFAAWTLLAYLLSRITSKTESKGFPSPREEHPP